jgi:hypothetical protein
MRGQPRWSRRGKGVTRLGSGAGYAQAEQRGLSCVSSFARSPCSHADARLRPEVSDYKNVSYSRFTSLPALPFRPPPSWSSYPHPTPGASPRPQPRKRRPPAVRSRAYTRARRQAPRRGPSPARPGTHVDAPDVAVNTDRADLGAPLSARTG